MQPGRRSYLAPTALAFLLTASGCGSGSAKLYKVSGKVTLDGVLVAGAAVQFEPLDPSTGPKPAFGRTGSDGVFTLSTNTTGDGAMAGKYKVIVSKVKESSSQDGSLGYSSDQNAKTEFMIRRFKEHRQRGARPSKPAENDLPEEYGNLEKTPFIVEVPSGAYDLALRKAGAN
jgi:hypothetical protein